MGSRRKRPRENNLADRYRGGEFDADRVFEKDEETAQRFSARAKHAEQNKINATAQLRKDQSAVATMVGEVTLVYSMYCDVQTPAGKWLCTTRKTLKRTAESNIVVGDVVQFTESPRKDETSVPEGVIEAVQPRRTVLTRADSFNARTQQPIVANADQMLIVASVVQPLVRWGLVDRMLIAAKSGGLSPVVCLNKIDLAGTVERTGPEDQTVDPFEAMTHYASIGICTILTSVEQNAGIDELRILLTGAVTVLAGHSGVGKSSLVRAVQPTLDVKIGDVSEYTAKGRHTTTSARKYPLETGGAVVDTPGVKLFGLWKVDRENLGDYFPDVENDTAPPWRKVSFERIYRSLPEHADGVQSKRT